MLEVEALWWQTVSLLKAAAEMKRSGRFTETDITAIKQQVMGVINQFETRQNAYPADVKQTEKYVLIEAYLIEVKVALPSVLV